MFEDHDMSVPFASTTISVLRITSSAEFAEPYTTTSDARQVVATGVRAHISPVETHSLELAQGGEQERVQYRIDCDTPPSGINHLDLVKDERTGVVYKVRWMAERFVPFVYSHGSLETNKGLV